MKKTKDSKSKQTKYYFLEVISDQNKLLLKPINGDIVNDPKAVIALRRAELYGVLRQGQIIATKNINYNTVTKNYVAGADAAILISHEGIPYIDEEVASSLYKEMLKEYRALQESSDKNDQSKKAKVIERIKADKDLECPSIEDCGYYIDKDSWYYLVRSFYKRKQLLILGPTGNGKTEVTMLLADRLKQQAHMFDMSISNPIATLCGNHRINSEGVSEFQYARFANVIRDNKKALVVLDELPRAQPTASNILLPLLDKRRTLYVETAMDEVALTANDDLVFWATGNVGVEFIGNVGMDAALLNRFIPFELPEVSKSYKIEVLKKRCGLSYIDASDVVGVCESLNSSDVLTKGVSMRQMLEIAELISDGYGLKDAFKYGILYQYGSDDVDGGERATANAIISSK